jgi:DNA-directed RNA polymerase sigma subunit (sigma70/sigma32)
MTAYAYTSKDTLQAANEPDFVSIQTELGEIRLSEDLALMNLIKAGDFDAKQKLITRNLCQVLKSYRRYANNGVGIIELLKAGNRGLAEALERFEHEGAAGFSGYAAWSIRQHIERILLNQEGWRPALPKKPNHVQHRDAADRGLRLQHSFA